MRPEIERFVNVTAAERYLEIGLGNGKNFDSVSVENKICVSPTGRVQPPGTIYNCRSDEFFQNRVHEKFDVIFIDGLHEYRQVARDLENSLRALKEDGVILIHDVNPLDKPDHVSGSEPVGGQPWCGDVWKIVFYAKHLCPSVEYAVIGGFPGWLVIWKTKGRCRDVQPFQDILKIDSADIDFARRNRHAFEFGTLDAAVKKFKATHHSVAGLMAVNNFPMAPELLMDLAGHCDFLSVRFDRVNGDPKIRQYCKTSLKQWSKKHQACDSYVPWNRFNWRESLIRSLDKYEPEYVLFVDEDESYESGFENDFEQFKASGCETMMFDYKMVTCDGRNPKKYPGARHCKAYRWKPGITYEPYAGYARPTNLASVYNARTRIEHYCFFTPEMEKNKVLHK